MSDVIGRMFSVSFVKNIVIKEKNELVVVHMKMIARDHSKSMNDTLRRLCKTFVQPTNSRNEDKV